MSNNFRARRAKFYKQLNIHSLMVSIDKNTCIGCGACAAACPEGFEMVDGKAKVKDAKAECIKKTAESCPVDAIKI